MSILINSLFLFQIALSPSDSSKPQIAGLFNIPNRNLSLLRLEQVQDSLIKSAKLKNKEYISIDTKSKKDQDLLFLKLKHGRKEHFDVSITDENGNEIKHDSFDFDPSKQNYTFDIHTLSPGFYVFKIYSGKTVFLRDFSLQRGR